MARALVSAFAVAHVRRLPFSSIVWLRSLPVVLRLAIAAAARALRGALTVIVITVLCTIAVLTAAPSAVLLSLPLPLRVPGTTCSGEFCRAEGWIQIGVSVLLSAPQFACSLWPLARLRFLVLTWPLRQARSDPNRHRLVLWTRILRWVRAGHLLSRRLTCFRLFRWCRRCPLAQAYSESFGILCPGVSFQTYSLHLPEKLPKRRLGRFPRRSRHGSLVLLD